MYVFDHPATYKRNRLTVSLACLQTCCGLKHTFQSHSLSCSHFLSASHEPFLLRLSESFNIFHHIGVFPCHPLFYWHTSIWDESLPTSCLLTLAGPLSPAAARTRASVSTDPGKWGGSGYDTSEEPGLSHQPWQMPQRVKCNCDTVVVLYNRDGQKTMQQAATTELKSCQNVCVCASI